MSGLISGEGTHPPLLTYSGTWLGLWTTTVIKSLMSRIFNVHFGNNQFSKRASGLSLQFPTVNTEPWVALINIVLTVHSRDKIDIYQKGTFFYLRRRRKFLGIGGLSFARRRRKKLTILNPEMRFPKGKSMIWGSGFSKFSRKMYTFLVVKIFRRFF